ncbi:hypothetical protein FHETE_2041 [Fusarium heterosporum]|uniref:Uncharacterized protein n=1 Tax=Fusarium heterosporum TaxID=42747 RepID=A0A8H5TW32_FUSHE|nr:hypothetical protein FHETE_2041 [Fusarium heterosporum]
MYSFIAYTLLASATLSVAIDPRFEFPDNVPLMKRQQPGTPQYECHEDCGLLITLAREKGFCDSEEWNEHYDRCMECANTYGIWKYYGEGVSKVAEQCELSPSPSPSGVAAASTTIKAPETTQAEELETSTAHVSADAPSTSAAIIPPEVTTEAAPTKASETTTPSTPTPSSVVVSGATKQSAFPLLAFAALAVFSLY